MVKELYNRRLAEKYVQSEIPDIKLLSAYTK